MSDSIEVLRDRLKSVHEGQLLLLEITQRIASGGSLGAMLPDIVNATLRVAGADGIRAVIHDPAHSLAYSAGAAAGAMLKYDATVWQLVKANGQLQVDDLANTTEKSLEPLRELGGALIALPLMAQGTLQGVLWMTYAQHKSFNPDDVRFLSILAGQTAVAIANAYAFDATRRGRAQLAAVLNSSVDPILVIDEKSSIVLLNPAAERAFALTAANVMGKPIADVINAEPILDLIKGVEDAEGVEWQTDNGQTYSLRISNMDNDAAHTSGRVVIMRDITRYRNLRDNQSEFVSTVSHDLRSPLTYMHGYATMMPMVGELNEKQRGFADKILSGIVQMTDLVDKILDASRLDPEGNYVLNREACDVTKIVSDIAGIHQQPAEKKNLSLVVDTDNVLPILNLDDVMLRRALNNLVDNAIKYTPEGGTITVGAHVKNNNLVFTVQDTGLGISEDNQKHLFERFRRVRRREHQGIKGNGLGLFIVRSVAQKHGGDAWIASKEGEGSLFTISIPLEGPNLLGAESKQKVAE